MSYYNAATDDTTDKGQEAEGEPRAEKASTIEEEPGAQEAEGELRKEGEPRAEKESTIKGDVGETLETTRSHTSTVNPVEGDGGETLEKTRSHTSTVAVTDRVSDDDCFMLSNMTVELVNIPQLSGGYLNSNALCILLRIPLFNSGHY